MAAADQQGPDQPSGPVIAGPDRRRRRRVGQLDRVKSDEVSDGRTKPTSRLSRKPRADAYRQVNARE
jgi:hypothetical protein